MNNNKKPFQNILIAGHCKQAISLAVCLLQAGHSVTLFNTDETIVQPAIQAHLDDIQEYTGEQITAENLCFVSTLDETEDYSIAIAIISEDVTEKLSVLAALESVFSPNALIAINSESIPLSILQQNALHPERIIGANWCEPVHTTYFLEIITNHITNTTLAEQFCQTARQYWQKDPYVIRTGTGIRSRMMSALLREAFYLIENDYVTVEDIDRACRNDAGYYLPFAGNFRYMDLMGGYMYGIVMQDLNPELSTASHVPQLCKQLTDKGQTGMDSGQGFYKYEPGEVEEWEAIFRKFSFKIRDIICKYPFAYSENTLLK